VSISHSGQRVGVATAPEPVGLDVELIAPIAVEEMASHVLGPGEQAEDLAEFYTYWTRKESAVKATGDGLRAGLDRVLVSPADQPARLIAYESRPGLVATMRDLCPGSGYAGALTVLAGEPWQVREHDATDLLT
jgi:4'-phosphopantetheinyl transferase